MPWMLSGALLSLAWILQAPPVVPSVDLTVPVAPTAFMRDMRMQLVYELHLTNFVQTDVAIAAIEIRDEQHQLRARYEGDELVQRLTRPGFRHDMSEPQVVGPGLRAVLNVWLSPASGPGFARSLTHVVELDVRRPSGTVRTRVTGGATAVSMLTHAPIGPPLRRGPWIAIYDPLLKGGHRTAVYTLGGRARIPGRFAIDFIALPPTGALPPAADRRPDANGFGSDVLAVADGVVAMAVDGVDDGTPSPVPIEIAAGNYVAIDLGDGRFAFYEHLQKGSVAVTAGDRVTRGQVIARLGSSGSSSIGPHLHFHLADAAATLEAEGVPFVFSQFVDAGTFSSLTALVNGTPWTPFGAVRTVRDEHPRPNSVIRFP